MKLSLCMIVKNESLCLERCLSSVKDYVDEIIIVDTGSTDNTKEIAKRFTDKVFDFKWKNDFAKARNFSLSKATGDWVLVLDADEVLDKESLSKIREAILSNKAEAYSIIGRNYTFDIYSYGFSAIVQKNDATKDYPGYIPLPATRIFKRIPSIYYTKKVHETVEASILKAGIKLVKLENVFFHHYSDVKKNSLEKQKLYFEITKKELEEDPKNYMAHYNISAIYENSFNDYVNSLKHIKLAYEYGLPSKLALIGIAGSLMNLKRYEEAFKVLKEALEKKINDPLIYFFLGQIFYEKKDYKKAKQLLEIFIKYKHIMRDEALRMLEHINSGENISYDFTFG